MTAKPYTATVCELLDPEIHPPPRGVLLLVATVGNVLIKAQWSDGMIAARLRKTNARKGTAAGHAVAAHGGQGDARPVKCEPAEVIRPGGNTPPDAVGIPVL